MSCKPKTYTVYQEINGEGLNATLEKSPVDAPDPHSNYIQQLRNQVRMYIRNHSETQPECSDGCRVIGFEETSKRRFSLQPRWVWYENHFDTQESPPVQKVAGYVAVGTQEISQINYTVFCAPKNPIVQSARMSDGDQIDWDISSIYEQLSEIHGESKVNMALLELGPMQPEKERK